MKRLTVKLRNPLVLWGALALLLLVSLLLAYSYVTSSMAAARRGPQLLGKIIEVNTLYHEGVEKFGCWVKPVGDGPPRGVSICRSCLIGEELQVGHSLFGLVVGGTPLRVFYSVSKHELIEKKAELEGKEEQEIEIQEESENEERRKQSLDLEGDVTV